MGRKPQYSADDILDAALGLVAAGGPSAATATAIGRALGAPSGSIYHRFSSRDELMARLWLRSIARYQDGILSALGWPDPDDALGAAISHAFDWTSENRNEALLLLQYEKADLVAHWPDTLATDLKSLNSRVRKALREYTERRYGAVTPELTDKVMFALIDMPYAAVRRHLPDKGEPASWLREFIHTSAQSLLARACPNEP
ncbi:transcriptional regulator, TetR family [Mycobacteroides abscessus 5S-0422]|uniref:Bacterial regulatory s, tetR family protein n=1 Tax=Mycobacteroides abscessus subsp. bolletii 1513 TaxID=1299321 RepID=X8DFW0_9MYCO|nr:TetR/AcrR family transcriptional regulator [Mycobacteroides abscessus]EUA66335.1 bacterial regulatory s, tetR family protein [Mycobacteroides abscessus subsp. bolletii 1513]EIU05310.1 transcriptional regulator, TetR family [Mycobacteroides abscessus 5S-0422]EIU07368.1 transcriptional regulator, TetR family [Mycobacteroides abscessus 5S-0421]EIU10499.1 transcriptional regulator, TetR family [Mycobacteroides abscessus 5S-0304]EIU21828.1 transcriptional regulator, TetR family [Mycobacteroides 